MRPRRRALKGVIDVIDSIHPIEGCESGADVNRISVWLKKTNNYAEPKMIALLVQANIDHRWTSVRIAGNLQRKLNLLEREPKYCSV